ncbi:hypothetical protein [Tabrizicola sp.]|uniref:hypothetical protein n=1 Tax=Tabrizicola sp. TaxID=2005166 RepID=UPI003D2E0F63
MTQNLREKIKTRLDDLETCLKAGKHLSSHDDEIREVVELVFGISKFSRILTEEEKDFLQCAMIALTEQKSWT